MNNYMYFKMKIRIVSGFMKKSENHLTRKIGLKEIILQF